MARKTVLISALLVMLATPARAHEGSVQEGPLEGVTNPLCPVTTDEPVDPSVFVDHDGKRVFFCCKRCRAKFLESPKEYVANVPHLAQAGLGPGGHSHESDDEDTPSTPSRIVRFAGKFHPISVHFPIALLLSALGAIGLANLVNGPRFLEAARVFVLIGAPMAVVATALGWAAGANAGYPGELATVLTRHRWLGTATAIAAIVTLIASERYWRQPTMVARYVFLVALGGTAVLVALSGHFGGTLIHGMEHFSW